MNRLGEWLLLRCPTWLGEWLLRLFPRWLSSDERPPIVWTDPSGVGWTRAPDYLEPWTPDEGQHETWKREMRVVLYRVYADAPATAGAIDLSLVGLSATYRLQPVPPLFPLGTQLADACRRLGFGRLAEAAYPDFPGEWEDFVATVHQRCVDAVVAESVIRKHRAMTNPLFPRDEATAEEIRVATLAELDVGPIDGPRVPPGRALAPLAPIRLDAVPLAPERFLRVVK